MKKYIFTGVTLMMLATYSGEFVQAFLLELQTVDAYQYILDAPKQAL